MERLEEELRAEKELETTRGLKGDEVDSNLMKIEELERKEDVERMWTRGTQGLVDLGRLPGVMAKLERAGKAAEVVEEL